LIRPDYEVAMSDSKQDGVAASDVALADQAVAESGAYEVLRKRLSEQGARLRQQAEALNAQRLSEFGGSRMEVIGRLRVRTEHNCVARDIVHVGGLLLFGYNVFIGLKRETHVADVFSLYRLIETADGFDVQAVPLAESFLGTDNFAQDFRALYAYYKNTRLLQLMVRDGKLLASFQIGERLSDIRVFRWSINSDGDVRYIDNRGERDIALPAPFDFEWTKATREHVVHGRHPHLNILDTVFVETINGDLTVKIENNTDDGLGIYREPVQDATQSLDDGQIAYAQVGSVVLLKILPYRETQWRYLIYNTLTRTVQRIDAIGLACVQLPEDHGVIFPGGYYLQNGESKAFGQTMDGMRFKRAIRSPNGEDVLYVFYHPEQGRDALFTYNLIERRLQAPIFGHGYACGDDGRMVIFSADSEEPTRVHPMQVWQTPFASDDYAARQPASNSFMGRIGNAELVRGLSDLLNLCREIDAGAVSAPRYTRLAQSTRQLFDVHHWLSDSHCGETPALLREITATSEAVIDEYEKVDGIRAQSERALRDARTRQKTLLAGLQPDRWQRVQDYVDALHAINTQRGHLLTIRDYRYIDVAEIDTLTAELPPAQARIAGATGQFLASAQALQPFAERLQALDGAAQSAVGANALRAPLQQMQTMAADLDTLSELMATLQVDDAAQRTAIVESISEIYGRLNQIKARAEQRRKMLVGAESVAQFGAQFKLFTQSIAAALTAAQDPERCDDQLQRLLLQLEQLESQYGEHEPFLADILAKREELVETFEAQRQQLLDERQRKAQAVMDAAERILESLPRRTARLIDADAMNAFFAGDALILKLRELAERLRGHRDSVKADEVEARLKAARDQAVRALRDRSELFEDGGSVIKLGPRHRFSVNTQTPDLTLLPRGEGLALHLTGTDYYEPLHDEALLALREYWPLTLDSESPNLYRGEWLAGLLLAAAEAGDDGLTLTVLRQQALQPDQLARTVRDFAAPRYRDGYEKGIHDHDAERILRAALALQESAGTLHYAPAARALAVLYWHGVENTEADAARWPERARAARDLAEVFGSRAGIEALQCEAAAVLADFVAAAALPVAPEDCRAAADYLLSVLAIEHPQFLFSRYARHLLTALEQRLVAARRWDEFRQTLARLAPRLDQRWALAQQALAALCRTPSEAALAAYVPEAAALLLLDDRWPRRYSEAELQVEVTGLLGTHPRIVDGRLALAIDDYGARLARHRSQFLPEYRRYQALRHSLLERERAALRLAEFKPRPLTSFVRNRLINELYLPVIGDNLAKQIGTAGEKRRSDLMGLLLLISPPGYGKTTLMEYLAHRLGLIFMKINGPALGHTVRALDPAQAPNATARQELEKLNLALEMGNNVMLYIDDIQHTHPEFLQKFISLCDGTRRVEGVWKGATRTYDLRGKKFCVVMAGNPYTESGEVFKIPDMLANRADIYNLGDVLGGSEDAFKLSYLENSLTANAVLAPLATRDLADLYRLIDKAQGREFSATALSYHYSGAEIEEIVATLQKLLQVREVLFKVNQQYILSAAQADDYRTEPPFRLQGSYRNMAKLAEKISPVMNAAELQQLIADHYIGEAQLLTTGAEENLLKLAKLRGAMTAEQAARWAQIKQDFLRRKAMGGDADVGTRVVAQLVDLVGGVRALADKPAPEPDPSQTVPWSQIEDLLQQLASEHVLARAFKRDTISDAAAVLAGLRSALDLGLKPLVGSLQEGAAHNAQIQRSLGEIAARLQVLATRA
jgi:hypothetical protein